MDTPYWSRLVCGTNTVLMAYLMYKSRLVRRFISVPGLVGCPLVFAMNAGVMNRASTNVHD